MLFSRIPTDQEKQKIIDIGIDFLEYIPDRAYVVSIPKNTNLPNLSEFDIVAASVIRPYHKIDPKLQNNNFPSWSSILNFRP